MVGWLTDRQRDGGIDEIPVDGAPGRLWLCGKHHVGPDPDAAVAAVGADRVVCLLERHELGDRYAHYASWLDADPRAATFAIPDLHATVDGIDAATAHIVDELVAGHGVIVHCGAGIGRAGTIGAAVLARLGTDLGSALATVGRARPGAGPQSIEQDDALAAWARTLGEAPVADLAARDRARVWHPYAPMPASMPQVPVTGADGTRLHLADGRTAIDGMSSWWAAIHGYRHPVLDAAARAQLDAMSHVMFGGLTHGPAIELAELLVDIAPPGLAHVFFADSGSVSVEVAIKMALQYQRGVGRPARSRILTVRGGYHGDTLACMSVCDPETGMHSMFRDVLPAQLFAPVPGPVFGDAVEPAHTAELASLLADHDEEIAAVILEPIVQGAGGMRFYAPGYLAEVRRRCDEHGVLLIADEIATGFGRTGRLFACEWADVSPDILCVGKALTGGYLSLAATLCTPSVAAGVSAAESGALMHGPTFMGNPLATAIALASVRLLLSRPWAEEVAAIERGLVDGLAALRDRPGVADVRVLGGVGVVEVAEPLDPARAQAAALGRGVWLRPFGRLLYTMPPFVASADDVAAITDAMAAVVDDAGRAP